MNKIKVIDLLNKIANGEEVPKNFTYKGYFWEYDKRNEMWFTYFTRCGEIKNHRFDKLFYLNECLNDEVEIIEEKEETKPITKESIEALGYACGEIQKCFTNGWNKSLKNEPLIEEDKKIEKLKQRTDTGLFGSMVNDEIKVAEAINKQANYLSDIVSTINEIIDYLEEK